MFLGCLRAEASKVRGLAFLENSRWWHAGCRCQGDLGCGPPWAGARGRSRRGGPVAAAALEGVVEVVVSDGGRHGLGGRYVVVVSWWSECVVTAW